ncbi:MAG: integrase [Pseudomonadota bacterium]|nr:integrase [Pseudomonadota bacterium]
MTETASSLGAKQSISENTRRAYAADWKHFTRWCRITGLQPLPLDHQMIARYLDQLINTKTDDQARALPTIERRLAGLVWNYTQRGFALHRSVREISDVLNSARRQNPLTSIQKNAITTSDLIAMTATLPFDLRGLRDRAILLLAFAGGLSRAEIVGLDICPNSASDTLGWITILEQGAIVTLRSKPGWRDIEIGRGSSDQSCPVAAVETWLEFAKINSGPLFVRTTRDGNRALESRLSDKHVARLVKSTVIESGIRPDLSEKDRLALYSTKSLQAGLMASTGINTSCIEHHLGFGNTPGIQNNAGSRGRFLVNLTQEAGL